MLALPMWELLLLTGVPLHPGGIVIAPVLSLDWKGTGERAQTRPGQPHIHDHLSVLRAPWHGHLKLLVFSKAWAPPL